jgi:hypothetical protein
MFEDSSPVLSKRTSQQEIPSGKHHLPDQQARGCASQEVKVNTTIVEEEDDISTM